MERREKDELGAALANKVQVVFIIEAERLIPGDRYAGTIASLFPVPGFPVMQVICPSSAINESFLNNSRPPRVSEASFNSNISHFLVQR